MKAPNFTKAEWKLGDENNACCEICAEIGGDVITVCFDRQDRYSERMPISREEMLANAYVMKAAPMLAEALNDLIYLAKQAMREANNDGAEYDIPAELEDAKAALLAAGYTEE